MRQSVMKSRDICGPTWEGNYIKLCKLCTFRSLLFSLVNATISITHIIHHLNNKQELKNS